MCTALEVTDEADFKYQVCSMVMLPQHAMSAAADKSIPLFPKNIEPGTYLMQKMEPSCEKALVPNIQVPMTDTLCSELI